MLRALEKFESAFGACAVSVLAVFLSLLAAGGCAAAFVSHGSAVGWAGVLLAVVVMTIEMTHMGTLVACFNRRLHPIAVAAALKHPLVPVMLRPIMAAWWGAHFVLALGLTLSLAFVRASQGWDVSDVVVTGFVFIATLGMAYAMYGYLLLAATTINPEPSVVVKLWRFRTYVNLPLAVLSAAAAWFA